MWAALRNAAGRCRAASTPLGTPLAANRLLPSLQPPVREMHFKLRMGRSYSHRLAMMRNMLTSLIEHERIKTPHNRAKMVSQLADRMVTQAKRGGLNAHRIAAKYVTTRSSLVKLFTRKCPLPHWSLCQLRPTPSTSVAF
jgi:ribosomal protein L17